MWYTFCAKPMILVDKIVALRCRSPCGERGLKFAHHKHINLPNSGRSPCGERGLKFRRPARLSDRGQSLPVRGAWVEIVKGLVTVNGVQRRSPCGERGLKFAGLPAPFAALGRRSPCGERGLKLGVSYDVDETNVVSLPVRGAWVEISTRNMGIVAGECRSPCGERGLK